ncbi:MAG: hypothetical protein ACXWV9_01850 [Flavisolibacter sp.]
MLVGEAGYVKCWMLNGISQNSKFNIQNFLEEEEISAEFITFLLLIDGQAGGYGNPTMVSWELKDGDKLTVFFFNRNGFRGLAAFSGLDIKNGFSGIAD